MRKGRSSPRSKRCSEPPHRTWTTPARRRSRQESLRWTWSSLSWKGDYDDCQDAGDPAGYITFAQVQLATAHQLGPAVAAIVEDRPAAPVEPTSSGARTSHKEVSRNGEVITNQSPNANPSAPITRRERDLMCGRCTIASLRASRTDIRRGRHLQNGDGRSSSSYGLLMSCSRKMSACPQC
jgi:hypothetical protein